MSRTAVSHAAAPRRQAAAPYEGRQLFLRPALPPRLQPHSGRHLPIPKPSSLQITRAVAAPLASPARSRMPANLARKLKHADRQESAPAVRPRYDREVEAAVEAVRLASKLCQAVQLELKEGEKYEKQGDASPVTVADFGAQAVVAWSLQRSLPQQRLSLIAEEDSTDLRAPGGAALLSRVTELVNATLRTLPGSPQVTPADVLSLLDSGGAEGGPVGRHWVLDPIDGTRGFVSMRQYAACLGMLQDGQVVLGVLGCPNLPLAPVSEEDCTSDSAWRSVEDPEGTGVVFAAQRGCGTHAGPLWEEGAVPRRRVFVDDGLPPEQVRYMEAFEKRHSNHSLSAGIADEIGLRLPSLRMDSQAKYGVLSRGDASIFMRFPPASYREKIWDHVAGTIVLEEAGGKVTDATGKPLDFSQGRHIPLNPGQPGIVAATPSMHAAIIKAFRRQVSA